MRTIKFRCWDGKTMDYEPLATDRYTEDSINDEFSESDSIYMQFTGLHDKNGKEIYEGDVLNHKTTFENNMADRRFQSRTEVLAGFENGCFIDSFTKVSLYEKIYSIVEHKIDFEVIGNIHQDTNLIK